MPTTGQFGHRSHFKSVRPRVHRSVRYRTLRRELIMRNFGQLEIKVETAPATVFARATRGPD
jgi:hypothetical protein